MSPRASKSEAPRGAECDPGRREALRTLVRGTCALAALGVGCGDGWREAVVLDDVPQPDAPDCGVTPGRPEDGWHEVKLVEHPALREPGGSAEVRIPEALLDVVVLHVASGCYAAVWRICTHGDCHVGYVPGEALLECPCHGSRFGEDGRVLRGPATRSLQTFRAARVGDSIFIHRPL